MTSVEPKIEESWKSMMAEEFHKLYFSELKSFLLEEKSKGQIIYPPGQLIFSAFNHTPFDKVKVVIVGQDPYHGRGQANGLCFSVSPGINPPPSLVNIFKELNSDLGILVPDHGNLEKWADNGVLLLNASLTVRANQPNSHSGKGWENFTDSVIAKLSDQREGIIFLLWGKYAQAKDILIDKTKHHILKAPHPSPYSASSGFFGCRHFSKANELLKQQGKEPVDWSI
ncbi:MAG TPA: uracil-DNA glycosylase [Bacteroidia bacterium]|nr:uracil-DNA glycosylase [Bacteroidia bacterium]